jgi:hypothetical protein
MQCSREKYARVSQRAIRNGLLKKDTSAGSKLIKNKITGLKASVKTNGKVGYNNVYGPFHDQQHRHRQYSTTCSLSPALFGHPFFHLLVEH